MPELDDELTNYQIWMYSVTDICNKQYCPEAPQVAPATDDNLAQNNSKTVKMLMKHTISKHIRPFIVKCNAFETYMFLFTYRSMGGEQRTAILDGVHAISSGVIKEYVHEMRVLQAQLLSIDSEYAHPEIKAPAYMTRLLDKISDEQKKILWVVLDRWRPRDNATELNCFQVGKNLQELLADSGSTFAQVSYGKKTAPGGPKTLPRGQATAKTHVEVSHAHRKGHSWADSFSIPVNAKKSRLLRELWPWQGVWEKF